ncbi:MAG: hypothetical protein Q4B54_10495 [Coriobacteriales bacterium]|nr:hypothetical protein [Coriobacteriales bacterium]
MELAKIKKTWTGDVVEHKGFKDLGRYVIELPDYTDAAFCEPGLFALNDRLDHGDIKQLGCTSAAKLNSKGELIFGRNMDLEISQDPIYAYRTTYGKYANFCVTYSPGGYKSYAEVQQLDELDDWFKSMLVFSATDTFNEKGLYIEVQQRTAYPHLSNYGLHTTYGETTRDDGTPWSELRANVGAMNQLISQNCATVEEAVAFVKNSYDWYTPMLPADDPLSKFSGWNLCYMIGDATGMFGLLEVAQDEVSFLPYQVGHSNYYITPKWNRLDICGAGEGRMKLAYDAIWGADTLEEAMDAILPTTWSYDTLWSGTTCRASSETHPNPCNQILFQDDKGNPQFDWRGDFVQAWPVLPDGRLVLPAQTYEFAQKSDYDPKIKAYLDEALACGTLLLDDGSLTTDVNGEQVSLTEMGLCYASLEPSDDPERQRALSDAYQQLLDNDSSRWIHDDRNFEAVKAAVYAKQHLRLNEYGQLDPSCMSKYEKLLAFYGMGCEKDEQPLRDDANIWTTSMNFGVNCTQKRMKIRLWENDETMLEISY